jgi:outer membrane protein assembly factor BamB
MILIAGPGTNSFVAAYNKKTGEEVWKKEFPNMTAKAPGDFRGSWSTAVVLGEGENALVLLSLPNKLRAVKPATGEEVWSCGGLGNLVYTSPLVDGDIVVSMSGFHGPAIACKLGGQGDVTETHRLWHNTQKNPQRVGSGVAVDGHVYIMNENGVVYCIEEKTGEKKWESRAGGTTWGSMVHVDGRLYVQDKQSTITVIAVDSKECRVLAQNEMKEGSNSSPAFSDGNVFVRTFQHLYCIE